MTKPTLTVGKALGMARTSTAAGVFNILALDHQDALREILRPEDPMGLTAQEIIDFKLDVMEAVQGEISGVLLDPLYGVAPTINAGLLHNIGLLIELERADYNMGELPLDLPVRDGWDVGKTKRAGADAAKFYMFYHPGDAAFCEARDNDARGIIADCAQHDIPFFLEPVLIPKSRLNGWKDYALPQAAVEMARMTAPLGAEVLKLAFPVNWREESNRAAWERACADVTEASSAPWVLLSAAVDHEMFCEQLDIACKQGATGYLGGRSVWGDACKIGNREERRAWLMSEGRSRVRQLADITAAHGKSWRPYFEFESANSELWYLSY